LFQVSKPENDRFHQYHQSCARNVYSVASVQEAVFNSANGAFSVRFPPLFVGSSLLALWASRVGTSSIGINLPRKFVNIKA